MNQETNNPFREGDIVYHPRDSKGKVLGLYTSELVKVQFDKHKYVDGGYHCAYIEELSFEPWPAPVHERPFEPTLKEWEFIVIVERGNPSNIEQGHVSAETRTTVDVVLIDGKGMHSFSKEDSYFFKKIVF